MGRFPPKTSLARTAPNFNLLRILAALAVLVTHCFVLATGDAMAEPMRRDIGMTMGSMAVDVFFITSGFLVTASLLTRRCTVEFLTARVLRIYPALLVMLVLTVGVMGAAFTSWPLGEYFASPVTRAYLTKCGTLLGGVTYFLPGVFEATPYPRAVNGSLWTMPYEIKMYLILAVLWLAMKPLKARRGVVFQGAIVASVAVAGAVLFVNAHVRHVDSMFTRLFFMFFSGAAAFVLRQRIALSGRAACAMAACLPMAYLAGAEVFAAVYICALAYLVLACAYLPAGFLRNYNRLGDYSYGVYIYAFPIQQAICALFPGISVGGLLASSTLAVFACAVASWHLVEKRALALKGRFARRHAVPAE
ncbi:MAG: acyltransferase family protein [Rhodospirillaceae bacterium]